MEHMTRPDMALQLHLVEDVDMIQTEGLQPYTKQLHGSTKQQSHLETVLHETKS
jgi:hypothetical protein